MTRETDNRNQHDPAGEHRPVSRRSVLLGGAFTAAAAVIGMACADDGPQSEVGRVVTSLGDLESVTPGVVGGMFATDLSFLQDHYRRINTEGTPRAEVRCPSCEHGFEVELAGSRPGES